MIDINSFNTYTALYHTFGCKLNFAETSTVAHLLAERGIRRVTPDETPDVIVVNTCSVTEEADRKCRRAIRSFHRRYPSAIIAITGCYAQLKPTEATTLPGVSIVAGINDKLRLPELIEAKLKDGSDATTAEIPEASTLREFIPSCSRGDRTRYFLKVQDGCDYWCSYCTIPKARGRSRSGSIDQLVAQAQQAADEGGREIVITGVNIGDFGKGRDDNFLDLCRALDEVNGIERYRISSIEPNLLTDETIDFVAASRHFMPHFHVPLQCGSDAVLQLMRRRYGTSLFRARIEHIKRVMPHAFIGVDLIVGARGETPERFAESRDFVDSLPISQLHVFPYSERPGTRALEIDYIVDPVEKHRRMTEMVAISERKHSDFCRSFIGTVRPVLLEHGHAGAERNVMNGFTDNYIKVEVDAVPELDNRIVTVRLDSPADDGESLRATITDIHTSTRP